MLVTVNIYSRSERFNRDEFLRQYEAGGDGNIGTNDIILGTADWTKVFEPNNLNNIKAYI
jgi:hypothetical protein